VFVLTFALRSSKVSAKFDGRKMKLVPSFTSEGVLFVDFPRNREEYRVDARYLRLYRRSRVQCAHREMTPTVMLLENLAKLRIEGDTQWLRNALA
jgi:hypothetical protein